LTGTFAGTSLAGTLLAGTLLAGTPAAAGSDRVLVCPGVSNAIRWRPGQRLHHLFEERCDQLRGSGRLAVAAEAHTLTYPQLDARANQLARYLLACGTRPGERIGLLLRDPVHAYLGMLATLKVNAAYLPLDAAYPAQRLSFIVRDAGVSRLLTDTQLRERVEHLDCPLLCLDELAPLIAAQDEQRLSDAERGEPVDELCYIIYTSGSTGRPKGVAVEHASICNFVRVAAEVYGLDPTDRVYQGMTIAFDFSVEEIWVPLIAGATLVPKPAGCNLAGADLAEYLRRQQVSALCCVPTLLATMDEELPNLRFLLVSGEACPQQLITRWSRPGRRFLNVYGPTETTVTATWALAHPDRPGSIGVPLPTYSVVILDPDSQRVLPFGALGEIGIAGIGLARGYLNRDDLTSACFIPDRLGIPNNPSGRIYRTGDLGRVNDQGEIEYHGRIDTQVKIRGYRVELGEIESVLLELPGIAQAVVATHQPRPGVVELVGYYSLRDGGPGGGSCLDRQRVYQHLCRRLPRYMVPAYLEELPSIPMLPSHKADRNNLPPPRGPRLWPGTGAPTAPRDRVETLLATTLAGVLGAGTVSVDGNFFDELGADSLLLAQFCARLRNNPELPVVSMRDVYLHPSVRALAAALRARTAQPAQPAPAAPTPAVPPRPLHAGTARYLLCGVLQLLVLLATPYLSALLLARGYAWVAPPGTGAAAAYLHSVLFATAAFLAGCALPIGAKWVLIGRWTPREFPVYSLTYFRFWLVKTLIRLSPLVLFAGSPLYLLYLRALGARIGAGVVILSRVVPVCTDLLTIGAGTVIRKDTVILGYRALAGRIQTGPVTLGRDVVIAEQSVLDIHTCMGDGAQLGHASALHAGQAVPSGQSWHGSPAQPGTVDYRAVAPARCGTTRRVGYSIVQLVTLLAVGIPLASGVVQLLVGLLERAGWMLSSPAGYLTLLLASLLGFLAVVLGGLLVVLTVPRVLNLLLTPQRVYPLYGVHYAIHRLITRLTNIRFYQTLFGDSSYVVAYLRALGYRLAPVEQTGSNFGLSQRHDTPYWCAVGTGTMVSDGLSMINARFSSTSFAISPVVIGERSFLGNNIVYPAGSRVGGNCLYATKVMVPIDGPTREGVGLLGSPAFEIPRTVGRDRRFDRLRTGAEFRHRLAAKNRHNLGTIALFLLVRWVQVHILSVLAVLAAAWYARIGPLSTATYVLCAAGFSLGYGILVERAASGFRAMTPRFCSIYDPYYWWHERFWKLSATGLGVLNGTPMKNVVWRLLGVRIGRRVFDDGCSIIEKTLVTIGDGATLGAGSTLQGHSLEEGAFKSGYLTLGAGCTVTTAAFVHYGVSIGEGAVLDTDAFLMKGATLDPYSWWRGNPAQEIPGAAGPHPPPTPGADRYGVRSGSSSAAVGP
jgi:non-ribosomal peptide synthetase-like protein